MTNEEIERAAKATVTAHTFLWMGSATGGTPSACREAAIEVLTKLIREASTQAYEEAAQKAEEYSELEPWYDTHSSEIGEAEAIATDIRALKDSLVQSPVSS